MNWQKSRSRFGVRSNKKFPWAIVGGGAMLLLIAGLVVIILVTKNSPSPPPQADIPTTVNTSDTVNGTPNKKYIEGDLNWKYTTDENDIQCLRKWDYYQTDKKTLYASDIPITTTLNKEKPWCATDSDTTPVDRVLPDDRSYFQQNAIEFAALGASIGLDILVSKKKKASIEDDLTKKKAAKEAEEKAAKEAEEKAAKEAEEKAAKEAQEKTAKEAQEKVAKEAQEKVAKEAQEKVAKEAQEKLAKEAQERLAKEAQERLAMEAKEKAAKKMATRNLFKQKIIKLLPKRFSPSVIIKAQVKRLTAASKSALKTATAAADIAKRLARLEPTAIKAVGKGLGKLGIKLAKALRPGPAIMFDALSLTLDLLDVGGYSQMESLKNMYKMKSESDKEYKQAMYDAYKELYKEIGIDLKIEDFEWPIILDPIGDDMDDLEVRINLKMEDLFASLEPGPPHPLIKPFQEKMDADIEAGIIKQEDLANDEVFNSYYALIDQDAVLTLVLNEWCTSKGGAVYDNNKCTLSEAKCNTSYSWPLKNDDTYTEFKDGKCVVANPTMKQYCESIKLDYNNKGVCTLTSNYCHKMVARHVKNNEFEGDYDCQVTDTQKAFEFIIGTSTTRYLLKGFQASVKALEMTITDPSKAFNDGVTELGWMAADSQTRPPSYTPGPVKINGKCVGVQSGKYPRLELQKCDSSDKQKFQYIPEQNEWAFEPHSVIMYKGPLDFETNGEDYCWEMPGGKTADGTNIYLNKCKYGGRRQYFDYNTDVKKIRTYEGKCISYDDDNLLQLLSCSNSRSVEIKPYSK